jgi:hypothetical protein
MTLAIRILRVRGPHHRAGYWWFKETPEGWALSAHIDGVAGDDPQHTTQRGTDQASGIAALVTALKEAELASLNQFKTATATINACKDGFERAGFRGDYKKFCLRAERYKYEGCLKTMRQTWNYVNKKLADAGWPVLPEYVVSH